MELRNNRYSVFESVLCWLLVILGGCYAASNMVSSTDVWMTLAAGRHVVDNVVDTTDPFSFNSIESDESCCWNKQGWINQNWLSGVVMYWLSFISPCADGTDYCFDSLVYLKFFIYIMTAVFVYLSCRSLGTRPWLCAVCTAAAMAGSRSFTSIRAADFTNLLTAVLIFIIILSVRKNILYVWLAVPVAILWSNLHGGFMYLFIAIGAFIAGRVVYGVLCKNPLEVKVIKHFILSSLVCLAGTVVFSPFGLSNITHPFVIFAGKDSHLWRGISEWSGVFDFSSNAGNVTGFLIFCSVVLFFGVWRAILSRKNLSGIDTGIIAVGAVTFVMAVCFRRFVFMACLALCPVICLVVEQIISFYYSRKAAVLKRTRACLFCLFSLSVLCFGIWQAVSFKRVYIDQWPTDYAHRSIFMRMTVSDMKPIRASQFITDNHLEGKMLNYWTEGGFIALAQEPLAGGQLPLKLYIDGRAQAAYDIDALKRWFEINRLALEKNSDKAGRLLSEKLRTEGVSVALLPLNSKTVALVDAIESNYNWPVVFSTNKQKVFVDINTEQGKRIFNGILTGRTIYPDEFTASLARARIMLYYQSGPAAKKAAFDYAAGAFSLGWYVLNRESNFLFLMLASWNLLYSIALILKFEAIALGDDLDGEYISDLDATIGQIIFGIIVVAVVIILCRYFRLHWIITYSICITYITTLDKIIQSITGSKVK